MDKVVLSFSGGLDSTTLLYYLVAKYGKKNVFPVIVDYHQRHSIEMVCAKRTCKKLGVTPKLIDGSFLFSIVGNVTSMVVNDMATPTNPSERMPTTYVPFRNGLFLMIMNSYAESIGANLVAIGLVREELQNNKDEVRYWDTTEAFIKGMQALADLNDKHSIKYLAPFVSLTKEDEIRIGQELGIDYSSSWTCYNPQIEAVKTSYKDEPAGGKNPITLSLYKPCGVCPS